MRILIATPLWPPEIGGPAQYAWNLKQEFGRWGHQVRVVRFSEVRGWPSGCRHLIYFWRLRRSMSWCDWCLALDTFSAALPATAIAALYRRPVVIRTGGDFLWEQYVERTGDLVLLRNFYQTTPSRWSFRERLIFRLTSWLLRRASKVVFSTDWQRRIWREPYRLDLSKTVIIENYYGPKETAPGPVKKNLIGGTRQLRWKNLDRLRRAFEEARSKDPALSLELGISTPEKFLAKIKTGYAVILVSLGDISPNLILEAIRFNKPFILTRETGLYDRLKEIGLFADPLDQSEIAARILWLADAANYAAARKKIEMFDFVHDWPTIAGEFLDLAKTS